MNSTEQEDLVSRISRTAAQVEGALDTPELRPDFPERYRFSELRMDADAARYVLRRFIPDVLLELPPAILHDVEGALGDLVTVVDNVSGFDPFALQDARTSPAGLYERIVRDSSEKFRDFFRKIGPCLSFLLVPEMRRIENAVASHVSQFERERDADLARLETLTAEAIDRGISAQNVLNAAREAVQEVGASKHARYFEDQALAHEAAAGKWLRAAIGLATAVVVMAVWSSWHVLFGRGPDILTPAQVAQVIASKLLIFSILASATVWCGRVYRAHHHNYVVNRHRANALGSFQTFVGSADDQTRGTVLVQATSAIFAPQHSGFATTESDPTLPSVTEVLKLVPPVKG